MTSRAREPGLAPNGRPGGVRWLAAFGGCATGLLLALAGCDHGHAPAAGPTSPAGAAAPETHTAAAAAVTPISEAEAGAFVGDAACAPCHTAICRQFAGTAHANTLRQVDARSYGDLFRTSQTVRDGAIGFTYRPAVFGGRCVLLCDGAAGQMVAPADLAVGRGQNGVTFIGAVDPDTWVTLRLSYYAVRKKWMFSPGQPPGNPWQPPAGQRLAAQDVVACLSCHVTYVRQTEGRLDLSSSHISIGCERCHGPGRRHVESATAAAAGKATSIAPPDQGATADPARAEALCGPCHSATEAPAHGGDAGSIREIERFETTALENSRCYRESRALSCINCHDPHTDVAHDDGQTNHVCLGCHSGVGPSRPPDASHQPPATAGKPCPVNRSSGCVRCHMPAARFPDVPSLPFHNHWIKVWRKGGQSR